MDLSWMYSVVKVRYIGVRPRPEVSQDLPLDEVELHALLEKAENDALSAFTRGRSEMRDRSTGKI